MEYYFHGIYVKWENKGKCQNNTNIQCIWIFFFKFLFQIEVPDLRTDFTLPVNCMPAFSFKDPLSKTTSHSTTEKSMFSPPATTGDKLTPITVRNPDATCSKFKFSTPISTGTPSPSAYPQKMASTCRIYIKYCSWCENWCVISIAILHFLGCLFLCLMIFKDSLYLWM